MMMMMLLIVFTSAAVLQVSVRHDIFKAYRTCMINGKVAETMFRGQ